MKCFGLNIIKMVCNKYVFCVVFLVVYLSIITIIHAQSKPAPPPTATTTEVAENVNRSLYYRNKNIDSSLYFAKIAANIATQTGKTYDLADALYAETVANYAAARYVKSLEYATKGLEISAKYNFVDKSLLFLNEVGLIYAELYDNFLALKYQFKALQLAEARQDTPFKAQLYNNIGLLKLKINPAEGIEYLRKALNIYKETNNTQGIASVYSNLGVAYIYQDSLVQAQGYFEKSLPIYQQAQDYWGQSVCYQNLGKIYTQKQQATLAYNNYEQALKVAKQLSSKELEARSLNGMAKNTNDAIACENLSNQAMRIGRMQPEYSKKPTKTWQMYTKKTNATTWHTTTKPNAKT
jgi:tetratricopeptide (TPR) repeat protein